MMGPMPPFKDDPGRARRHMTRLIIVAAVGFGLNILFLAYVVIDIIRHP